MPDIVTYLKSRAKAEQEETPETDPNEATAEEITTAIEEALS